jgi:hypothetical protein
MSSFEKEEDRTSNKFKKIPTTRLDMSSFEKEEDRTSNKFKKIPTTRLTFRTSRTTSYLILRQIFFLGLFGIISTSFFYLGIYCERSGQTACSNSGADLASNRRNRYRHVRENATILVLCRNSDLAGILKSMTSFEDTFNSKFHYPYTFFNEETFSVEFMQAVRKATRADVAFEMVNCEKRLL